MTNPTPQSDQAATTPGRAEELATWLAKFADEAGPETVVSYYDSKQIEEAAAHSWKPELESEK